MQSIAHIYTPFPTKFGIPRQAGLADTVGRIVFDPPYRVREAVRGLEGFDYLWLIWQFHQFEQKQWSPTVRPPRLGGNRRMGVFATRSPNRPNPIGLSSVKLQHIEQDSQLGPVLWVLGADMADGTPIYDIKPYLPYADSHPTARSGYATQPTEQILQVSYPPHLQDSLPPDLWQGLVQVLSHDPRPQYQHDPQRVYVLPYADWEIKFQVKGDTAHILDVAPRCT